MKIVIIGIQGSGKSTQGNMLSEKLNIPYLSTGQIFRILAKEETELGRYIKEVMNKGYLIPDDKTIKIVNEYLERTEYVKKGYVLDGFPRTIIQAKSFSQDVDYVIYLKVSDKEALFRIAHRKGEARQDETEEAIKKRIESFHKFTKPVLDFYRQKNLLIEVDGEKIIEDIHRDIFSRIQQSHGE